LREPSKIEAKIPADSNRRCSDLRLLAHRASRPLPPSAAESRVRRSCDRPPLVRDPQGSPGPESLRRGARKSRFGYCWKCPKVPI
jgi:hypothetical protein